MKKHFSVLRQKTIFAVNLAEMLKEATIHFFLIDESHFWNICTLIMWQYIEIDCVNIEQRSGTAKLVFQSILVLNWVKKVFPVSLSQSKYLLGPKN